MALGHLNFDDITEKDLDELIDVGVPEGLIIEYKRDIYGKSDADKKEALKDISSFANSFGGHLIIGIEERNGIPYGQLLDVKSIYDHRMLFRPISGSGMRSQFNFEGVINFRGGDKRHG